MSERHVLVVIDVSDDRHCDNSCVGMAFTGEHCQLFNEPLRWNGRKKSNGYIRCNQCIENERKAKP